MKTELKSILTKETLRQYAGGRSYERGEAYYDEGVVSSLVERNGKLTATVRGSENYSVKLWADDDGLGYTCSCPLAQGEGEFCKHCVAVGLAWLKGGAKGKDTKGKGVTIADVEAYLRQQSMPALVELLMEQVTENERLRERLLMKVARANETGIDLGTFRKAIKKAVKTGGYVDYYEMSSYADGIADALESITDLLKEGYAEEVIQLSEFALEEIEKALQEVDDSSGELGSVHEDWQTLHHDACVQAKSDPVPLARRLYEWEMTGDGDTFFGAVDTYADVLGEAGIAEYRRLAEAAWAKLHALKPGQNQSSFAGNRFRLTRMMESLARQSGDIEALVAIKKKDLSASYHYLQIAEIYRDARKYKDALAWAEKGKQAFPENTDVRLLDFLAEEYQRAKRPNEALQIIWQQFTEKQGWQGYRYSLETYKKLHQHATRANCWPEWRERAWEAMRDHLEELKTAKPAPYQFAVAKVDHSRLVEIFWWEKNYDAAWAEAEDGGCSNALWLTLAKWREQKHPADAIPVYQRLAEASINEKNNSGYETGVQHIRKVRELLQQFGRQEEFVTYVQAIRTLHKPKRNLMKLLEKF